LAGGLVLTAAVCAQTRRFGVQKHLRIETTLLDNLLDALRSKLDVNIALLAAVVGLFNSSSEVNRQQFSTFFETVSLNTTQLKGVQGMGFARWIPADQLQSYESRIRSEGFPTFTVLPPGPRAHYSAIEFLEPFNWRNQRAFGFDMFSEPVRRQAMQRARHTGNATLGLWSAIPWPNPDGQQRLHPAHRLPPFRNQGATHQPAQVRASRQRLLPADVG
jgi:CHASE1-domain containing sensor protein